MTNAQVREMFDKNPNMTVAQLARLAGKTRFEVIAILLENK